MVFPKHSDLCDVTDILGVVHCLRLKLKMFWRMDLSLSSDGNRVGEHAVMGPAER
jgi:hypothetical protein